MIKPIFLISQPRAGSTLLQRYIALSPAVSTLTEPWSVFDPLRPLTKDLILSFYGGKTSINAGNALQDVLGGNDCHIKASRAYLSTIYNDLADKDATYFLDKTPRYYYVINELSQVFPDSSIIILYRNPLAVLSSFIRTWGKSSFCHFHAYIDDLLLAPKLLVEAQYNESANIHFIKYEDFVQNPSILNSILPFISSSSSTSFEGTPKLQGGLLGDEYSNDRPIDVNSIDAWRTSINTPVKWIIYRLYLRILGAKLITSMGYSYNDLLNECKVYPTNLFCILFSSLKDLYYLSLSLILYIFQFNLLKARYSAS